MGANAISRIRGDTAADEITVTDEGAILDITGFTFRQTLNSLFDPPDNTTELYEVVGAITDAANGVVEFAPSVSQANQIPDTYYYDVEMVDGVGRIKTIAKDEYVYTQDIGKVN